MDPPGQVHIGNWSGSFKISGSEDFWGRDHL